MLNRVSVMSENICYRNSKMYENRGTYENH